MPCFETNSFTTDFKELLTDFEISVETYQQLELVFRQALSKSLITQYEFQDGYESQDEFGFGLCRFQVARGRSKARELYRQTLAALPSWLDSRTQDECLQNVARTLRFHVALDFPVNSTPEEEHVCYLAFSEKIFRPFFELHFQNRRHTSERYHEFIALKRMMELGGAASFAELPTSRFSIETVMREIDRMNLLTPNWLGEIVPTRDKVAA